MNRRVGAVVLAAGSSQRMGHVNKLTAPLASRPLVAHIVDTLLSLSSEREQVGPLVVVTGHEAELIRSALAGRALYLVHNEDHEQGISRSIAVGVRSLRHHAGAPLAGVLICLGDMPLVRTVDIEALLDAFDTAADPRAICRPMRAGRPGHPVLFAAEHFEALGRLRGDQGARSIVQASGDRVITVPVADQGVLCDVDTPAQLRDLRVASRNSGA